MGAPFAALLLGGTPIAAVTAIGVVLGRGRGPLLPDAHALRLFYRYRRFALSCDARYLVSLVRRAA